MLRKQMESEGLSTLKIRRQSKLTNYGRNESLNPITTITAKSDDLNKIEKYSINDSQMEKYQSIGSDSENKEMTHATALDGSQCEGSNVMHQSDATKSVSRVKSELSLHSNSTSLQNQRKKRNGNGNRRIGEKEKKGRGKFNKYDNKLGFNVKIQFRTPTKKDNHDHLFYDQNKMPLQKLFEQLEETTYTFPKDFKASKVKIKVTEDQAAAWSCEHETEIIAGTDVGKTLGHLKFENTSVFKLLGILTMYDGYIKAGEDFTILTRKEKVWGQDKDMIYVGTNKFKVAMFLAYAIGGAAVSGNFLGSLGRCSNFRMQFSNPEGDYKKVHIRWETKEWYEGLRDVLSEWIKKQKKVTHGALRFDLLKRRFYNDQKCLKKNEIPLNIQQHNIPMHPDNFLNSLSVNTEKIKPGNYVLQCWKETVERREFNLVNDFGALIRFFRPFKKEAGEKEILYQDKKHKIEATAMKNGGMSEKQQGRFNATRRKKTQSKLRQISITNRFLKVSDRESNLHKGFAYLFTDVTSFATLESEDLFEHLMKKEKERCHTTFLNEFDDKNPEEAAFRQLWANCGGEAEDRDWLMKLLHHMKKNLDKQLKKLNYEVGCVSTFAAESRNIMEHRTSENSLKADLALHYISEMMKENGDDSTSEYKSENVEEVKTMLRNRKEMSKGRNGGVPTIYKAKDILAGKTSLDLNKTYNKTAFEVIASNKKHTVAELINFFNSGEHYNVEAAGFTASEEKERGLKRKRSDNSVATKTEEDNIEKELKRRKKECDFKKPIVEPVANTVHNSGGYKEGQTFEQIKHFDRLLSGENEELRDDLNEGEEPSTMTNLAIGLEHLGEDNQDISPRKKALNNIGKVALEGDDFNTPKKKTKPDRAKNRIAAVKNMLAKGNAVDSLLNISENEITDYNFKASSLEIQDKKVFKFRHGVNIVTMKKFKWPIKGKQPKETDSFQLKIYLKVMRDTWHCMVLRYIQLIIILIKVFRKIDENRKKDGEGLNVHFVNECNQMIEDLDNLRRLLDLESTTEKLIQMDRAGVELVPIPSLAMYEAIQKYLPAVASCADLTLNLTPVSNISHLLETTQANRTKISGKITNKDDSMRIENQRTGKECIANDRNLFFDEFEERIEKSELLLQSDYSDISYFSENCSDDLTLNEICSPLKCQIIEKPQSTPIRRKVKTEEPKGKVKTSIKVNEVNGKHMIGETEVKEEFLGYKVQKTKQEHNLKCIKMPYIPKESNAPIKWEYADELFTNFAPVAGKEFEVALGNFKFKTKIREKTQKPLKTFPLSILYTNLNPPIQIKLKNLVNEFPLSTFVCVTELMQKGSDVLDNSVIPLGYKPYCHKMVGSGMVYAMILVKNCIEGEVKILYDEPPFILLGYRKGRSIIAVGTFYRPHDNSVLYDREFTREDFNLRLGRFIKSCKKVPAIIMADCNIDFDSVKGKEQRLLKNIFEMRMASFTKLNTGPTFWKNEQTNTTIDHVWFNRMITPKWKLYNGRTLVNNDGHAIMEIETNITMNGVIGETKICSRPKLDPKTVKTLGGWMYDDLNRKLEIEESKLMRALNEGNFEGDDNSYCELAFDFFENFFKELQPEKVKTIKIYNNRVIYSQEIAKLNMIAACLCYDIRNESDALQKNKLENALKSIIKLRDRGRRTEERVSIIGRLNANEDDIHTICKSLRPKLRGLEITKEIFTADQLIDEFVRVYENVVRHVDESKVVVNILDMLPKIDEAMKFSFKKWLPTWEHSLSAVKTIEQCFNQLKPVTRGLNSSLYRDGIAMLPIEYCKILNNMILYWVKAGNYPKKFLSGKLRAILKKGDPTEIQNRRFISVGNFFQQLLGKVVASCLLAFCEKEGLLDQDQFGFRTKRSCDQAVAQLINKVGTRHSKTVTAIIMLDLSSAFFCVKKDLLIDVLSTFVNNDAMKFFRQMLRPIKAKVVSDGIESDEKDVPDYGVRQGDGCSPLFFNITINKMFEYVRREMRCRYDKEMVQIQGFADDSILIITATTVERLKELISEALKKTNDYVTSVGFKINAKKSEVMIVTEDKKKRDWFGEVLNTEMGEMKIKESLNILGLRVDNKLTFKPQFNHLMTKIGRLRKDTIELIGMGTNKEILSNAFAKSNGIYLYGIGMQGRWTQRQYKRAQREVNDLIRMVYNIKWKRELSWSQRDLLRLANWPPIRLQHEMATMLFLNKMAMMPDIKFIHDTVSHHLRFPNGRKVLDIDYRTRENEFMRDVLNEDWIPVLKMNVEDKKHMGKYASRTFPLNAREWFNNLPNYIKYRIGTKSFDLAVYGWYHVQCWCRSAKECSKCKKRDVLKALGKEDITKMFKEAAENENSTIDEWTRRSTSEIDSFHMALSTESDLGETFEDFGQNTVENEEI